MGKRETGAKAEGVKGCTSEKRLRGRGENAVSWS